MTRERLQEIRDIVTDSQSLGNGLESFTDEITELLAAADCLVTIKDHAMVATLEARLQELIHREPPTE